MALAVSVGERLARWAVVPRVRAFDSREHRSAVKAREAAVTKYRLIDLTRIPAANVSPWEFVHQTLIAPIRDFFVEYYENRGDSLPQGVSRHLVAHNPQLDNMNPFNALKSAMLVTSIVRSQQEWMTECESLRADP